MRLGGTFNEDILNNISPTNYQNFNKNHSVRGMRKTYFISRNAVQSSNSVNIPSINMKKLDKDAINLAEENNMSGLISQNPLTRKTIASSLGSYQHINKFHKKQLSLLPNICKSSISKDEENELHCSIDNNDYEIGHYSSSVRRDRSKIMQIETTRMKKFLSPMERNIEGLSSNKVSSRDKRIEDMPPNYFVHTPRINDIHIANNIKKNLLMHSRYKSEIIRKQEPQFIQL